MNRIVLKICMLLLNSNLFLANAQLYKAVEGKKIFIQGELIRFDSLLDIISRQTGLEFSFNSNRISPFKKLVIPKYSRTFFQWLDVLDQKMKTKHKLVGNHVIFVENYSLSKRTWSASKKGNSVKIKKAKISGIGAVTNADTNKGLPDFKKTADFKLKGQNQNMDSSQSVMVDAIVPFNANDLVNNAIPLSTVIDPQKTLPVIFKNEDDSLLKGEPLVSQEKNAQRKAQKKNVVSIGGEISFPVHTLLAKNKTIGLSINLKGHHFFSDHLAGTASIGYSYFPGKIIFVNAQQESNFSLSPVYLGVQYHLHKIYAGFELGYAFRMSKNVYSNLSISPSLGCKVKKLAFELRLFAVPLLPGIPENTFLQKGGYSYLGLRVNYSL